MHLVIGSSTFMYVIHRGYYMAARRYEISLRVLKIFHEWAQRTSEIFFQHEKRNFVSPSGHVIFYLLYKHQWNTKPFHFYSFLVWKARFHDVAIAKVIFSHVKITCYFHIWRYQVFARKLTWYFIGFYITKLVIFHRNIVGSGFPVKQTFLRDKPRRWCFHFPGCRIRAASILSPFFTPYSHV